MADNLTNGATQDGNTKSRVVSQIARIVRKHGLDYEDWRYVSRRIRQECELKPAKQPKTIPRVLSAHNFQRFYEIVDQAQDVQHSLMLRLMFYTAVRVSELCNIRVDDVDLTDCKIRIEQGKGSKDRYVLFGKSFTTALRTHIAAHPQNRWLFQTRRNSRFSTRRIQQIVKQHAGKAGVRATPHTLRHQAITFLTRSGMPDAELQSITGHARRETLAVYQHVVFDEQLEQRYQRAMKGVEL